MALRLYNNATHAARYWLLRRLPSCKELAPVMSESLDRSLTLREWAVLRLHLWVCLWCVRYMAQLHFMRAALRLRTAQAADDTSAPELSPAARTRLKHVLKPSAL